MRPWLTRERRSLVNKIVVITGGAPCSGSPSVAELSPGQRSEFRNLYPENASYADSGADVCGT
jgi:hypothetical protein